MIKTIRSALARTEEDPAFKRRLALWMVLGVTILFASILAVVVVSRADPGSPPSEPEVGAEKATPPLSLDDPRFHERAAERQEEFRAEKRKQDDLELTLFVVIAAVCCLTLAFGTIYMFRWLDRRDKHRRLAGDWKPNPVTTVLSWIAILISIGTPPIGWIILYLWHLENLRNRENLAVAEALEEIELYEEQRELELSEMAERLDELEREHRR